MGRSSAEQALQNRASIVEIASRLFRERGIEAVSVADVMAAAGMTVGGFYKHFASKEALVDEAVALAFGDVLTLWNGLLDRPGQSHADTRARLVAQYLRPNPQRQCPIIAFAPHASGKDDGAPARGTYDRGSGALLARFFGEAPPGSDGAGPADGGGDAPDPQALLLFAAMVGARVLAGAAGETDWVSAVKAAVVEAARQQAGAPDQCAPDQCVPDQRAPDQPASDQRAPASSLR
ncbi:TetR/AcrR family transcriptional regulator [Paracoccus mangrovi]|uniref:TetR/AcrR family transcriptional regulator n=1 Tax=Paracoccus mangrovi TaxID=1715645 RepID=A0ABV7R1R4_9RHOB